MTTEPIYELSVIEKRAGDQRTEIVRAVAGPAAIARILRATADGIDPPKPVMRRSVADQVRDIERGAGGR